MQRLLLPENIRIDFIKYSSFPAGTQPPNCPGSGAFFRDLPEEVSITQKRCIQTEGDVIYYRERMAAAPADTGTETGLWPPEMSAPAAAHGAPDHTRPAAFLMYFTGVRERLPGQIDHSSHIGFRRDAAEPLPAKRGRAGNGRLIFPRAFFRGRGRAAADRRELATSL